MDAERLSVFGEPPGETIFPLVTRLALLSVFREPLKFLVAPPGESIFPLLVLGATPGVSIVPLLVLRARVGDSMLPLSPFLEHLWTCLDGKNALAGRRESLLERRYDFIAPLSAFLGRLSTLPARRSEPLALRLT